MPETLEARAPRRTTTDKTDCPIRVQAELVSLGGGVMLAICMLVTALLIMALYSPDTTGMQRAIAIILTIAAWIYLFRSSTEELTLVGEEITYRAKLASTRTVSLKDLETMLLVHQGLNLERGIETIEFRLFSKKVEHLSLGPCWQRHKLEAFLGSVEDALHSPKLLETVR
ncbi:MAG: hypothetical protein ABIO72_00590 [Patescibacteria group bacterium]